MKTHQQKVIDELRAEGYSIVLWTPEELGETNVDHLEDVVIERGNNFISDTKE